MMVLDISNRRVSPIIKYLTREQLPEDEAEAMRIRIFSTIYVMMANKIYKMRRSMPMLKCLVEEKVEVVLA